jgi:hypothetical protein
MFKGWCDIALLAVESQHVMALRLLRLSTGGARANSEAQRMVTEKATAAVEAAATMMTGGDLDTVVKDYRRRVRRNARRLRRR